MAVAARKLDNDYVYARSSTMRVYTHRMPAEADTPQAEAVAQPAVKPRYSPLQRLAVTCGILMSAIHQRILPLPGHICTHNCTELEQIRENRLGI